MSAALPEEDFHLDELLRGVVAWVEVESPTTHPQGVNRMMDLAEAELRELGAVIERRPGQDGFGDVVSAQLAGRAAGPGVLVPRPSRHGSPGRHDPRPPYGAP